MFKSFRKSALGVLAALCLCSFSTPPDPYDLTQTAADMSFPGVTVTYEWKTCGFVNAWYSPLTQHVTMCEELKTVADSTPGFVRYVFAHELAHAVIMQLDLAYTGSSEGAADELSSLVLTLMGNERDVLDGADFWFNRPSPEDPTDAHLSNARRGWGLLCMVATKRGEDPFHQCDITYQHSLHAWTVLLGLGD